MAAGAGALAAVALPGNRIGLGAVLVALAVAGAVAGAGKGFGSRYHKALAGLALALSAVAVLRAAGWLVALDLVAALALASLAAADGRSWRGLAAGLAAVLWRLVPAPAFVAWCSGLRLRDGAVRRALPAVRGLALGCALAVVFGALFASADRAFARLADEVLTPGIDLGLLPARVAAFVLVTAVAGALVLVALRPSAAQERSEPFGRAARATEWTVAVAVLDALFLAFVAIQLTVLFGGHDHVLRTDGLTYAQYAREGFAHLLAVALLTLAVIAAAVHGAGAQEGRGRPSSRRC